MRNFSIRYLFAVTLIVALAMVPLASGIEFEAAAAISLSIVLVGFCLLHKKWNAVLMVGITAFTLLIGWLFWPVTYVHRTPGFRAYRTNNIRQIGLAILNYESVKGHFPPPYTTDENGQPLHSWRVLILPYIEEEALYEEIDLSKPWDHPDNLRLANRMPVIFDRVRPMGGTTTDYVAIVGDDTLWTADHERKFSDVGIGSSTTLLVVESQTARTHWMAPNDIDINSIAATNPDRSTDLLPEYSSGQAIGCFGDNHTQQMPATLSADALKTMATIAAKRKKKTVELQSAGTR